MSVNKWLQHSQNGWLILLFFEGLPGFYPAQFGAAQGGFSYD